MSRPVFHQVDSLGRDQCYRTGLGVNRNTILKRTPCSFIWRVRRPAPLSSYRTGRVGRSKPRMYCFARQNGRTRFVSCFNYARARSPPRSSLHRLYSTSLSLMTIRAGEILLHNPDDEHLDIDESEGETPTPAGEPSAPAAPGAGAASAVQGPTPTPGGDSDVEDDLWRFRRDKKYELGSARRAYRVTRDLTILRVRGGVSRRYAEVARFLDLEPGSIRNKADMMEICQASKSARKIDGYLQIHATSGRWDVHLCPRVMDEGDIVRSPADDYEDVGEEETPSE